MSRRKPQAKPAVIWLKVMVASLDDYRIAKLALTLGVDYANAFFLCMRVWKHLYDAEGAIIPPEDVDAAAQRPGMAQAMLDAKLAEARTDGLRIKGDEHAQSYALYISNQRKRAVERHANARESSAGAQKTSRGTADGTAGGIAAAVPPNSNSRSSPEYPDLFSGSALSTVTAISPESAPPLGDKAPKAKGPRPPKKPPDLKALACKEVGDYWTNLWASAQGETTYHWTKAEFLSLQPLVEKHGPGEVKTRMFAMIKNPPEGVKRLLAGAPPTVAVFVKCFNSFASWSSEKAAAAKVDVQDDLHRDEHWKRKAELRFAELNALANRKVPAWWGEPDRVAMKQGMNGEPVIPLVALWTPKDPSYLLRRLCDYVTEQNKTRSAADHRDVALVEEWYRKRFRFGGEK